MCGKPTESLINAVQCGTLDEARRLLCAGADPNMSNPTDGLPQT